MDITISSKSYHLGTSGIDSQLKTRKSTTVTFAVQSNILGNNGDISPKKTQILWWGWGQHFWGIWPH